MGQWVWMLGAATNVDRQGRSSSLAVHVPRRWSCSGRRATGPPRRGAAPAWLQRLSSPSVRTLASLGRPDQCLGPAGRAQAAAPAVGRRVRSRRCRRTGSTRGTCACSTAATTSSSTCARTLDAQLWTASRPQEATALAGPRRSRDACTTAQGFLMLRDLRPSTADACGTATPSSTNRWGMRDRDYAAAKPRGTLRIAMLGPSHVMGNGVADGETFEALARGAAEPRAAERRHDRRARS